MAKAKNISAFVSSANNIVYKKGETAHIIQDFGADTVHKISKDEVGKIQSSVANQLKAKMGSGQSGVLATAAKSGNVVHVSTLGGTKAKAVAYDTIQDAKYDTIYSATKNGQASYNAATGEFKVYKDNIKAQTIGDLQKTMTSHAVIKDAEVGILGDAVASSSIGGAGLYAALGGNDISINYQNLEDNLAKLKRGLTALQSNWDGAINANISKLESSWAGEDCKSYISKLKKADANVKKVEKAIELLIKTYTEAINKVKENQNSITNTINNL